MNMDPNSIKCIVLNRLYKLRKYRFDGVCLNQGITDIKIGTVKCMFTGEGIAISKDDNFNPSETHFLQYEDISVFERGSLKFFNGLEIKIEELE